MLATERQTVDEAIETLESDVQNLRDRQADTDPSTDKYEALQQQIDRLRYFQHGLCWQRDEAGWDGDAVIEIGALTAGEKAMMHREAPDHAGPDEMQLWFVAASTTSAPYHHDDLGDTFDTVADCHPGFVGWAEASANILGVPDTGAEGNGSETSSAATPASETSTGPSDSPT